MPDREKVINSIRACAHHPDHDCQSCDYCGDNFLCFNDQLIEDFETLMKEQEEPKQIIRKQCKKEWEDGSIDYYAEWYCPHCNSLILRGFDNLSIKFCYKCGKPILWEGR